MLLYTDFLCLRTISMEMNNIWDDNVLELQLWVNSFSYTFCLALSVIYNVLSLYDKYIINFISYNENTHNFKRFDFHVMKFINVEFFLFLFLINFRTFLYCNRWNGPFLHVPEGCLCLLVRFGIIIMELYYPHYLINMVT